jgi:hypothetical protein
VNLWGHFRLLGAFELAFDALRLDKSCAVWNDATRLSRVKYWSATSGIAISQLLAERVRVNSIVRLRYSVLDRHGVVVGAELERMIASKNFAMHIWLGCFAESKTVEFIVCSIAIETSMLVKLREANVAMVEVGAFMQLCLQAESHNRSPPTF